MNTLLLFVHRRLVGGPLDGDELQVPAHVSHMTLWTPAPGWLMLSIGSGGPVVGRYERTGAIMTWTGPVDWNERTRE